MNCTKTPNLSRFIELFESVRKTFERFLVKHFLINVSLKAKFLRQPVNRFRRPIIVDNGILRYPIYPC